MILSTDAIDFTVWRQPLQLELTEAQLFGVTPLRFNPFQQCDFTSQLGLPVAPVLAPLITLPERLLLVTMPLDRLVRNAKRCVIASQICSHCHSYGIP